VPGGLLHVLELGAVLERRSDECRPHRVRRVTAIKAELGGIFPDHAIDRVLVHAPAFLAALAVVLQRPEQRPVGVGRVPRGLQIGAKTCGGLRIDRERVATAALARDAQRIEAAVLVQIADLERGDLGAAQADLQADGEDRTIAQAGDRVFARRVEQFARLRLGEGERRAFVAIDRRPLDLADRIARRVVVADRL
jgi:hypothetical protein